MRHSHNITGSDVISRRSPPPGHGATTTFGAPRRRRRRPAVWLAFLGGAALVTATVVLKVVL